MTNPPRNLFPLLASPSVFLALGGGVGLIAYAPGTVASLLAIPLALLLRLLPFGWQIGVWAAMCVAGLWFCDRAAKALGEPDHPAIVWDEICGMLIVLLLSPPGMPWAIAAFLAFRVFDILKPWPINVIDRRMPNSLGAMGDDLMAAAYAIVVIGVAVQFV